MSPSLQVLYPISDSTDFDYEYYFNTHLQIVGDTMGEHIKSTLVTKGIAGGPDAPAGYYAIATMVFENKVAMDAAMSNAETALNDIPNFTNTQPVILIGEVVD